MTLEAVGAHHRAAGQAGQAAGSEDTQVGRTTVEAVWTDLSLSLEDAMAHLIEDAIAQVDSRRSCAGSGAALARFSAMTASFARWILDMSMNLCMVSMSATGTSSLISMT